MNKKLVVLCDGTWNTPTQAMRGTPCPTNVVKVSVALAPQDRQGREQRQCYRKGVGNNRWERLRGGAFGLGLSEEVKAAYRFLMDNYEPGDELYFLGFSRGAYTVRSAVGLVRNSGILRRDQADRVDDAFALYRARELPPTHQESARFRQNHSHPSTRIRFMGVWDTVGALGIPVTGNLVADLVNRRWQFHDTQLSSHVEAAFQALAIDERRRPFKPALWVQQPGAQGQRLEQVWFAGDHCDVGGGHTDAGLSDIALRWMIDRAEQCGLTFEPPGRWAASADDAVRVTKWTGKVDPNPLGGRCPQRAPLPYRLVRQEHEREIGKAIRGQESVAKSAMTRWHEGRYRPPGLRDYLGRGGTDVTPV